MKKNIKEEPGYEYHNLKKNKKTWIIPVFFGVILMMVLGSLILVYNINTHKETNAQITNTDTTDKKQDLLTSFQWKERTTKIFLPPANGEMNWSNPNIDKVMLTAALTNKPSLNGKVRVVYIIKGHPSGQDMVWIQTDQSNKIIDIMCERKYTNL